MKVKDQLRLYFYDDKLYVYEVNNKGVKSKVVIDTINKNDLDNYKNI